MLNINGTFKFANKAFIGDCLIGLNKNSTIIKINKVYEKGVYSPLT
jgi:hypothetical protein